MNVLHDERRSRAEQAGEQLLAEARAQRPQRIPARILTLALWRKAFPELNRLDAQRANFVVGSALLAATQSNAYKLTVLAVLLAIPFMVVYFDLHPIWAAPLALGTYVLQLGLAAHSIKQQLPELLAAGVEVGEV